MRFSQERTSSGIVATVRVVRVGRLSMEARKNEPERRPFQQEELLAKLVCALFWG